MHGQHHTVQDSLPGEGQTTSVAALRWFLWWHKWLNEPSQFWYVFGDHVPNPLGDNVEVFVDESMSHTDYPFLGNLRVFLLVLGRNLTSRLPYYLNLSHYGVLRKIISLELLPCCTFGKLPNLACRKEHIQKVGIVTPHKLSPRI